MKSRALLAACLGLGLVGVLSPALGAQTAVGPSSWVNLALHRSRDAVYDPGAPGYSWVDRGVGTVIFGVVVVGDTAYFATLEGNVEAVDARTGAPRWTVHLPNAVFGPPLVANGVVYVGIGNDTMALESSTRWVRGTGPSGWYALDASTGKILWSHPTVGEAKDGLVLSHGVLYTAGGGGHLRAMSPTTGKTIWKVFDGGVNNAAEPVVVGNLVISPAGGPAESSLWAFDRQSGKLVWRHRGDDADNTPTYGHGMVYETNVLPFMIHGKHMAQDVYTAVDAATGKLIWAHAAPLGPFPFAYAAPITTLHRGVLYGVSSMEPFLMALNARTGQLLWQTRLQAPSFSPPAVVGGHVFTTDQAGYLDVLDAATGRIVASRKIGSEFGAEPVTIVHGTLYLATFTGNPLALADPGVAKVTAANTGNVMAIPVSSVLPASGGGG